MIQEGIMLVGPEVWVKDHQDRIRAHGTSAMQYTPGRRVAGRASELLDGLPKTEFGIFVYIPQAYVGGHDGNAIPGSGKVDFFGQVKEVYRDEFWQPVAAPADWPAPREPRGYDRSPESPLKATYWLKLASIQRCTPLGPSEFDVISYDGNVHAYNPQVYHGRVVFVRLRTAPRG